MHDSCTEKLQLVHLYWKQVIRLISKHKKVIILSCCVMQVMWCLMLTNSIKAPPFHLEVAVLAYDRPYSLARLLKSLQEATYDGDNVTLKICIDRPRNDEDLYKENIRIAEELNWPFGAKIVKAHPKNVGAYIQWYECWQPDDSDDMFGLILEDDLRLSPYYYRWLKAALLEYKDDASVGGITLQRGTLIARNGKHRNPLCIGCQDPVFFYRLLGTWGFAPMPKVWKQFRHWVFAAKLDPEFIPYVRGEKLMTNAWLMKRHLVMKTMPESYSIYFLGSNHLFTVYANLPDNRTLACNHREPGMNYKGGRTDIPIGECDFEPLMSWSDKFVKFPVTPVKLDWDALPELPTTTAENL